MFSWKHLFSDKILTRGEEYYDKVTNVKRLNNRIFANVEGQFKYFVCVTLNNEKISSIECNCYFDGNCMHEVALLHYIEEHNWLLNNNDDENYYNLINSMDEATLKEILMGLSSSKEIRDKIINKINTSKPVDKKQIEDKLIKTINNQFNHQEKVISDVLNFVEIDIFYLIESGEYDFATKLLNEIVETYLIHHENISYDSEDILTNQYINYSKILLEKELSPENRKIMQEYLDELCAEW